MSNVQEACGLVSGGSGQRGRGGGGRGLRGRRGRGGRADNIRKKERNVKSELDSVSVPGPSTRSYEEEIKLMRKSIIKTKKVLPKLEPGVQKELDAQTRPKPISRSLLPDAPPRKKLKKSPSPERVECRLVAGTPITPPKPKLQPWEIRKQQKNAEASKDHIILVKHDPSTTPNSTINNAESSVAGEVLVEFEVDSSAMNSSVWVEVDNAPPAMVKTIDLGIYSYSEKTEPDLQKFLDIVDSDEDDKDEADIQNDESTTILPHQMTTAYAFDDIATDLHTWLTNDDKESDRVLTKLIPTENFISFDWIHDHNSFRGKREPFTGVAGPTFPVTDNMTPLDIFLKFFDNDLFDLIVRQTNKNAIRHIRQHSSPHSRLNFFRNVDRDEIAKFLAILILQGLFPNPVEKNYWGENGYLTLKYFGDIMIYNRFVLLKRLLHFSDPTDNQTLTCEEEKLEKIQPVLNHLQQKFSSLYLPRQEIAIDESLLKWQGRLSFSQKIATKAAKVGVKSYELCESDTGYLWRFFIYTGKSNGHTNNLTDRQTKTEERTNRQGDLTKEPKDEQTDLTGESSDVKTDLTERSSDVPLLPTNATSRIVHNLMKPLYNLGHTLVMDNFYNSPLLARYLKSKKTDCFGTLRLNREFVPEAMKEIQKHELREGEIVNSYTEDLSVVLWRDSNVVSLISTYHDGVVGGAEKYGRYKYKPKVVLDYNRTMGGVDKKDQLLSAFPIERVRNIAWYKKVFRRLLNITLLNAHIIFSTRHKCSARDFRRQVAEGLVKLFQPAVIVQPIDIHTIKMIQSPKIKKIRPVLRGNHFICQGPCKMARCVWCKKSRTRYICEQCQVSLCLEICFKEYHTVP